MWDIMLLVGFAVIPVQCGQGAGTYLFNANRWSAWPPMTWRKMRESSVLKALWSLEANLGCTGIIIK